MMIANGDFDMTYAKMTAKQYNELVNRALSDDAAA